MKKLLGLFLFLLVLYFLLLLADPGARTGANHFNLGKRIALNSIISLGVGILIISGGIDLSIGSVVALCSTLMGVLLIQRQWHPLSALATVLACGAGIGLFHGLLVTRVRVQAFVVTLCGLFIYRGIARWLTNDGSVGLASGPLKGLESPLDPQVIADRVALLKQFFNPSRTLFDLPLALLILLVLAGIATLFLHFSVYGRYLYAIGSNEQAARYSGVAVDRYKVLAYVLCSSLAAFFGVLSLMDLGTSQPSQTGSFLELYAIAGAVLGGCSLRGGEGSVLGIIIGTAILWILPNFTNMWGVPKTLEYTVIGGALLVGAILDELLRRRAARAKVKA
jgi:ribose transport system permease protein